MKSNSFIFLSKNIRHLRKKAKFSQQELALKVGVLTNTISNYETGKSTPDYTVLYELLRTFDVSSDDLLYRNLTETPARKKAPFGEEDYKRLQNEVQTLSENDRINSMAIQTFKNEIFELKLKFRELKSLVIPVIKKPGKKDLS